MKHLIHYHLKQCIWHIWHTFYYSIYYISFIFFHSYLVWLGRTGLVWTGGGQDRHSATNRPACADPSMSQGQDRRWQVVAVGSVAKRELGGRTMDLGCLPVLYYLPPSYLLLVELLFFSGSWGVGLLWTFSSGWAWAGMEQDKVGWRQQAVETVEQVACVATTMPLWQSLVDKSVSLWWAWVGGVSMSLYGSRVRQLLWRKEQPFSSGIFVVGWERQKCFWMVDGRWCPRQAFSHLCFPSGLPSPSWHGMGIRINSNVFLWTGEDDSGIVFVLPSNSLITCMVCSRYHSELVLTRQPSL